MLGYPIDSVPGILLSIEMLTQANQAAEGLATPNKSKSNQRRNRMYANNPQLQSHRK